MTQTYSSGQVARRVGIDRQTLFRWLWSGKVKGPRLVEVGDRNVLVWTDRDIERVARFKELNYRKGRGRKPK